jgi:hypothetical protein
VVCGVVPPADRYTAARAARVATILNGGRDRKGGMFLASEFLIKMASMFSATIATTDGKLGLR